MRFIAPLVRGPGPRDVLVNVMYDLLNWQKDRVADHVREQMRDFFSVDPPTGQDEDELFEFYRQQLKSKCGLQHAADVSVPHPTHDRSKFHLVVGGKNPAVLHVFREVEKQILGSAAAQIRDEAVRRAEEERTRQLTLLVAPEEVDRRYKVVHDRDIQLAEGDILKRLSAGPVTFGELWPEILERRHLTERDLAKLVGLLRKERRLVITGKELGRAVRAEHLLALPGARAGVPRKAGVSEKSGAGARGRA